MIPNELWTFCSASHDSSGFHIEDTGFAAFVTKAGRFPLALRVRLIRFVSYNSKFGTLNSGGIKYLPSRFGVVLAERLVLSAAGRVRVSLQPTTIPYS